VRVEIMGSQTCGFVGKSQSVLIMISPMIFTRTRKEDTRRAGCRVQMPKAQQKAIEEALGDGEMDEQDKEM
jgi:hypothetical protein